MHLQRRYPAWTDFVDSLNFNILELTIPSACLGSMDRRLLLGAIWPYAFALAPALFICARSMVLHALRGKAQAVATEPRPGSTIALETARDRACGMAEPSTVAASSVSELSVSSGSSARRLRPRRLSFTALGRMVLPHLLYVLFLILYLVLPSVTRSLFEARLSYLARGGGVGSGGGEINPASPPAPPPPPPAGKAVRLVRLQRPRAGRRCRVQKVPRRRPHHQVQLRPGMERRRVHRPHRLLLGSVCPLACPCAARLLHSPATKLASSARKAAHPAGECLRARPLAPASAAPSPPGSFDFEPRSPAPRSFLWRDYRAPLMYWELLDLIRKVFLAALILFVQTDLGETKVLRLVIAALVSAVYLVALALARPFERSDDLYLSCLSNLLLTCWYATAGRDAPPLSERTTHPLSPYPLSSPQLCRGHLGKHLRRRRGGLRPRERPVDYPRHDDGARRLLHHARRVAPRRAEQDGRRLASGPDSRQCALEPATSPRGKTGAACGQVAARRGASRLGGRGARPLATGVAHPWHGMGRRR